MYKIIGADQKEYGPISADQIREWISEGRVNGQTQVCAEGSTEWKPLDQFPEFAFTAAPVSTGIPAADSAAPVSPEEILARDYTLDIGSCLGRGWTLFKNNVSTLLVSVLILLGLGIGVSIAIQIIFAAVGVNHLPMATRQYLGPLYGIFSALVLGPAAGGVFMVILAVIRGQPASPGDVLRGFNFFQDLFLGKLIPSLAYAICMLPYTIAYTAKIAPLLEHLQQNPPSGDPMALFSQMLSAFTSSLPMFIICMIPTTYLSVNWQFTLPLIVDKKMGFWTAMKVSWKMVHKHWFSLFGLTVLTGLINIGGACLCCVGLLATVPFTLAAMMYAYEDIFGRKNA